MDKNQQFPDTEEQQYDQEQHPNKTVSSPRIDPYPAEERDLDEEAHRQLEEGR